jgi:hypothetical protein
MSNPGVQIPINDQRQEVTSELYWLPIGIRLRVLPRATPRSYSRMRLAKERRNRWKQRWRFVLSCLPLVVAGKNTGRGCLRID